MANGTLLHVNHAPAGAWHVARLFLLISSIISLIVSCTKTVYVRVPAVCPRDPYCLSDGSNPNDDAKAREREFAQHAMASTVDVRITRYVPNKGRVTTKLVGALISPKGYVLTADAHFDGADTITVSLRTPTKDGGFTPGREMTALPLIVNRHSDLAFLVLGKGELLPPSFPIRFEPVIEQDRVWFYGNGTALHNGTVIETAIVSNEATDFSDAALVSTPEDIGAPLLNICGELIGVAVGPYGKNGTLRFVPITLALERLQVSRVELR